MIEKKKICGQCLLLKFYGMLFACDEFITIIGVLILIMGAPLSMFNFIFECVFFCHIVSLFACHKFLFVHFFSTLQANLFL